MSIVIWRLLGSAAPHSLFGPFGRIYNPAVRSCGFAIRPSAPFGVYSGVKLPALRAGITNPQLPAAGLQIRSSNMCS